MFRFTPTTVIEALEVVKTRKLDQIRCCVTGAPYATIESDEILMALESEYLANRKASVDRLVDSWELRALTFNSQMLPSLRGVKETALIPHIARGHAGQVRVLTYMMTRLMYPNVGGHFDSEAQRGRMLFASDFHDAALTWDESKVIATVQYLVAIDSFCNLTYWRKMWAFESRMSSVSIYKAPGKVQNAFNDPSVLTDDIDGVQKVITYLFKVMLFAAAKDSNAGLGGNKQAQAVFTATMPEVETPGVPLYQKKDISQADIDRFAKIRAINSSTELKVAWSATHGKGTPAGQRKPSLRQALPKNATPFSKAFDAAFARFAATAPSGTIPNIPEPAAVILARAPATLIRTNAPTLATVVKKD